MSGFRRIVPMVTIEPPAPRSLGQKPELRWVKPTTLMVDGTYQRNLSSSSIRLIQKMVREFTWSRMKPPIVAVVERELHVIDGQHTAIAAATLGLPEIPIFVIGAAEVTERARAFVGHNTDRIAMQPLAIHRALVRSGDPFSCAVDKACRDAGVRLRIYKNSVRPDAGDCMAVGYIKAMMRRRGVVKTTQVLTALGLARLCPIASEEVRAAEVVICDLGGDPKRLAMVARAEGKMLLAQAQAAAKMRRMAAWRVLTEDWAGRLGLKAKAA